MLKNLALAVLAAYAVGATLLLARPAERSPVAPRLGEDAPAASAPVSTPAHATSTRANPPRVVQSLPTAALAKGQVRHPHAGARPPSFADAGLLDASSDAATAGLFPLGAYDPAKLRQALDSLARTDLSGDARAEVEAWLGAVVEANRDAAAMVLARLRSEAEPDLLWTLAAALGRSLDEGIAAELVRMAQAEPDASRRRAALGSLSGRSDQKQAVEALLAAARGDADPACRAAGAAGLNLPLTFSTCRGEDRIELLARARGALRDIITKESELDLRTCAINALGSACSTAEDVDLLLQVVRTGSSADLRAVAVAAVARTGRKDAAIVQPLVAIADDASQDVGLRMAAAGALEEMMVLDPAVDAVVRRVNAEFEQASAPGAHAGAERPF
ncbi:MAG: hypothetical protein HYZ53_28945 [Planctomycetes bacterium]|nr:hypothetical protein [Planctomycetota bacterium]